MSRTIPGCVTAAGQSCPWSWLLLWLVVAVGLSGSVAVGAAVGALAVPADCTTFYLAKLLHLLSPTKSCSAGQVLPDGLSSLGVFLGRGNEASVGENELLGKNR